MKLLLSIVSEWVVVVLSRLLLQLSTVLTVFQVSLSYKKAAAPTITLRQHTAAAAGTSSDLIIALPHTERVDGADAALVDADGSAVITVNALNGAAGYVTVELEGQDLTEGNTHISVIVDGLVAARNGVAVYEAETECKPAYLVTL